MNPPPNPAAAAASATVAQLLVITGMSGSGKSVALRALEDAGFYCVDNLPPPLLEPLVKLQSQPAPRRLAVAIDVRSGAALPQLPLLLHTLRGQCASMRTVFLDAGDDALLRRFSETRRRHPLSLPHDDGRSAHDLTQAISRERELLADMRARCHVIDTTHLRAAQLQAAVKSLAAAAPAPLTLVLQSFAFKRGPSLDADFVFDVRMLPNPHYEAGLRALTGLDAPVAEFLGAQPQVAQMLAHIGAFLQTWLPEMERNHRSYVTVAIGCTGGQHRSVYLVEKLAAELGGRWLSLRRHRELDAAASAPPPPPA